MVLLLTFHPCILSLVSYKYNCAFNKQLDFVNISILAGLAKEYPPKQTNPNKDGGLRPGRRPPSKLWKYISYNTLISCPLCLIQKLSSKDE